MIRLAAILCILAGPALAQGGNSPFVGAWIWDPQAYEPPPNAPTDPALVAETMVIKRDDGARFIASFSYHYANGASRADSEDIPEDGRDHSIGTGEDALHIRIIHPPGEVSHTTTRRWGTVHESSCDLSGDEQTMVCEGSHTEPDGTTGHFRCVYHRDAHATPVAARARPGKLV